MAASPIKKRYQLGDNGAIFVPNVTEATLAAKVAAKEWIPRPDLDKAADKKKAPAPVEAKETPAT
jgi:hypothetical protein